MTRILKAGRAVLAKDPISLLTHLANDLAQITSITVTSIHVHDRSISNLNDFDTWRGVRCRKAGWWDSHLILCRWHHWHLKSRYCYSDVNITPIVILIPPHSILLLCFECVLLAGRRIRQNFGHGIWVEKGRLRQKYCQNWGFQVTIF